MRKVLRTTAAVLAAFALAACSGDGGSDEQDTAPPASPTACASIEVKYKDSPNPPQPFEKASVKQAIGPDNWSFTVSNYVGDQEWLIVAGTVHKYPDGTYTGEGHIFHKLAGAGGSSNEFIVTRFVPLNDC